MQVEWRRAKVLELLSKGDSQSEIAKTLQVDLSIINRERFLNSYRIGSFAAKLLYFVSSPLYLLLLCYYILLQT
jgi:hypothetical protein